MSPTIDPREAAEQLSGLEQSNAELARRAVAQWWYHPVLGALTGGMIAVQAAPLVFRAAYWVVFALGIVLLVQAYRRKTGVWVSGWRAGRTRWVSATLAVLTFIVGFASVAIAFRRDLPVAFVIGGAIIAVMFTLAGPAWERAFRRDLEQGGRQ